MDAKRLAVLEGILKSYLEGHPTAKDWSIHHDAEKGLIETNWYSAHKGEVRLKTEIWIFDDLYRIDVWQNIGLVGKKIEKTEWSRREEWALQKMIVRELGR